MVTREDLISQSIFEFAKAALTAHNYMQIVDLREAFPYTLNEPQFTRNIISVGFDFDDDGKPAEMGSDLTERNYTVQVFTFGLNNTAARNIANFLKFQLAVDSIPLLDVEQPGMPEIDRLMVNGVSAERQIIPDPEPWQQFVWMTVLQVEDIYYASLA